MEAVDIQVLVDGRRAETPALAAERLGMNVNTLRPAISRAGLEPVGWLDDRTPLYDPAAIDAMLAGRPGRGRRVA